MATDLTLKPMRHTGTNSRYTGLPKIGQNNAVFVAGDQYPSARLNRRGSVVSSNAATPTWMAQAHTGATKITMQSAANSIASVYTVDPTTVDWPNITLTHQRPRNPNGGIPRYTKALGTSRLYDNLFHPGPIFPDVDVQDVSEDRQLLLSDLNTWIEANKLPPLCTASLQAPNAEEVYASATVGHVEDDSALVQSKVLRWLGGKILVGVFAPTTIHTVSVWAIQTVNPPFYDAPLASRVLLGTIVTVPGHLVTATYSIATIGASITRWTQFWLNTTTPGGSEPGCVWTYTLYSPLDVPPVYDCPGVDCFLRGGFLS